MSPSTESPTKASGITGVAQTTVDALRTTPVLLSILLFNLGFMATLGWVTLHNTTRWDAETARWAELAKSCVK